jgi:hypothetical protein
MVTSECTEVAQAPSGVIAVSTVVTRENGDGSVPGGRHKTRPWPYSRAVPSRVSGQRKKTKEASIGLGRCEPTVTPRPDGASVESSGYKWI